MERKQREHRNTIEKVKVRERLQDYREVKMERIQYREMHKREKKPPKQTKGQKRFTSM